VSNLLTNIDMISKEKGIDSQIVLEAVRDAMLVAARKQFKTQEDMIAEFDQRTGDILVFIVKQVVETVEDPLNQLTLDKARKLDPNAEIGGVVRISKPTDGLGRIAAQTAKQVIMQKIREAERDTVFREYNDRIGEMVPGSVKRIEGPDMVIDIGKSEARMPKREQSRLEGFSVGDRIRVIIKAVEKSGKTPGVIVSRADPDFVVRLFEQEVPEIYDGTVVVKACAREAGERTKIAVLSKDRDVDSVGACVGMKGMRVQSIIRELRGEKIDIIEYSDDPKTFAMNALSPAKITRVAILDTDLRHMEVIVDDSQLSLAIGKKGQNVRLAAKLLGWRIDIKSQEEKRQEVEMEMSTLVVPGDPVSVLLNHGLPELLLNMLVENGVGTVETLGAMTPEQLARIPGMMDEYMPMIQSAVLGYYGQFEAAVLAAQPGSPESEPKAPAHDPLAHLFPSNFGQTEDVADAIDAAGETASGVEAEPAAETMEAEQPPAETATDSLDETEPIQSEDVSDLPETVQTKEETGEAAG
jgi:N utilization substance protein A